MTAKLTPNAQADIAQVLESDQIRVIALPEEGGRIGSMFSRETGVEFLEQPRHPRKSHSPSLDACFQNGPCAGIEECLPSVGRSSTETRDGPVPDHGDFWQLSWQVQDRNETALRISSQGFSRPLLFSKMIAVHDRLLQVSYAVLNAGEATTSFLYACHPLFAVGEGDVIVLPSEVSSLSLNYSRQQRLGAAGDIVSWPRHESANDLSLVLPYRSGVAEMLYTGRLAHGGCGVYRSSARQGIALRFRTDILPFLGVWLCYGGWPESADEPLQFAVALEPTIAPFGTLLDAQRANAAYLLKSNESVRWTIDFELSEPDISLEEFRRFCSSVRVSQPSCLHKEFAIDAEL